MFISAGAFFSINMVYKKNECCDYCAQTDRLFLEFAVFTCFETRPFSCDLIYPKVLKNWDTQNH